MVNCLMWARPGEPGGDPRAALRDVRDPAPARVPDERHRHAHALDQQLDAVVITADSARLDAAASRGLETTLDPRGRGPGWPLVHLLLIRN